LPKSIIENQFIQVEILNQVGFVKL